MKIIKRESMNEAIELDTLMKRKENFAEIDGDKDIGVSDTPSHAGAIREIETLHKNAEDAMEDKVEETNEILDTMDREANMDTKYPELKKLHLSEELFTEAKHEVEELDDDMWTLVYDSIFSGNRFYRPKFTEKPIIFEEDRFLNSPLTHLGYFDIGIELQNKQEEEYIKKLASELKLETKPVAEKERKGLAILIPDEKAEMSAKDYLDEIGINIKDIRNKKENLSEQESNCTIKEENDTIEVKNDEIKEDEPKDEDKEEILDTPEENEIGIANTINKMVIGEWETIQGYNDAVIQVQALREANIIDEETGDKLESLFKELSGDEMAHVGNLQKALSLISNNTPKIKDGEKEAEEIFSEE